MYLEDRTVSVWCHFTFNALAWYPGHVYVDAHQVGDYTFQSSDPVFMEIPWHELLATNSVFMVYQQNWTTGLFRIIRKTLWCALIEVWVTTTVLCLMFAGATSVMGYGRPGEVQKLDSLIHQRLHSGCGCVWYHKWVWCHMSYDVMWMSQASYCWCVVHWMFVVGVCWHPLW